jgi:putative transcriptional regulator
MTKRNALRDWHGAYASGRLDPAFALMVETQATLREDLRAPIEFAESISGALLEAMPASTLTAGARARTMAALDAPEEKGPARAPHAELDHLPEPVRSHIFAASAAWPKAGGGVQRLTLPVESDLIAEVYRIAPGAAVPRHSHEGEELTLVLCGGFSDEAGHYGPGDCVLKQGNDTHQPRGDEDSVCYVLSLRGAGLRFTGALGFVQRLVGQ